MMPCYVQESHSLIHSFFYYSYIVSFHLISSHLQGDNNKNKLLKMQCSIYSLFFLPFLSIFLALAWPEKEKKRNLCNV